MYVALQVGSPATVYTGRSTGLFGAITQVPKQDTLRLAFVAGVAPVPTTVIPGVPDALPVTDTREL